MSREILLKRCRCCLIENEYNMKNLDEKSLQGAKYSEMLNFLIGLKDLTNCPTYLCSVCEIELTNAYLFKRQCIENEKKFICLEKYENNIHEINVKQELSTEVQNNSNWSDEESTKAEKNVINSFSKTSDPHYSYSESSGWKTSTQGIETASDEYTDYSNLVHISTIIKEEVDLNDSEDNSVERVDGIEKDNGSRWETTENDNSAGHDLINNFVFDKDEIDEQYRSLACRKCNLTFTTKRDYHSHYEKLHRSRNRPRYCRKCNITFTNRKDYINHCDEIHQGENLITHSCPRCNIKFNSQKAYFSHYAKVHRKQQISCLQCGKTFNLKGNLRKHERIHTDDRRYRCEFCGKKFIHRSSWKSHLNSHYKTNNLLCNIKDITI